MYHSRRSNNNAAKANHFHISRAGWFAGRLQRIAPIWMLGRGSMLLSSASSKVDGEPR